jgi:hypothetical protein
VKDTEKFLVYCRLTCFGGSSKGTCPCKRPSECELTKHPKFSEFRFKAEERLQRYIANLRNERTEADDDRE